MHNCHFTQFTSCPTSSAAPETAPSFLSINDFFFYHHTTRCLLLWRKMLICTERYDIRSVVIRLPININIITLNVWASVIFSSSNVYLNRWSRLRTLISTLHLLWPARPFSPSPTHTHTNSALVTFLYPAAQSFFLCACAWHISTFSMHPTTMIDFQSLTISLHRAEPHSFQTSIL